MSDKKGRLYFDLIQSFWIAQRHFGLSAGSVSFYFYLLNCFNSARWPKELGISSMEVQGILGISKKTLYNFKAELTEINAIEAEFQTGRIKQIYRLNSPTVTAYGVTYGAKDGEVDREPDREVDREVDREADREADRVKFTPSIYIDKDEDKNPPPISPPVGDRIRNKEAEEIYQAYPRKVAKPVAIRAIKKHLSKIGFVELMNKTEQFAKAVEGSDPQFIPHPSTFYNQERFNDDPASWKPSETKAPKGQVSYWVKRERELTDEMRRYKLAHMSETAMESIWDKGSKEKYNEMWRERQSIRDRLEELSE